MRRLRTLFLALPLALAAGGAMAGSDIQPVGGYGYGYGGGYGYGRPYYAPPPPPRHWGPAPVYRPYGPPPRPYWGGPHWRPQPHWRHRHGW
jgi:hypothetical protein